MGGYDSPVTVVTDKRGSIEVRCRSYEINLLNTPFTRSSWLNELARRAGYMLAGRASSMLAGCLPDVCSMFAWSCKGGITLTYPTPDSGLIYRWLLRHAGMVKRSSAVVNVASRLRGQVVARTPPGHLYSGAIPSFLDTSSHSGERRRPYSATPASLRRGLAGEASQACDQSAARTRNRCYSAQHPDVAASLNIVSLRL